MADSGRAIVLLVALDIIVKICGLLIIGLFAWMMLRIWKIIK